jgi:hypothetical protein
MRRQSGRAPCSSATITTVRDDRAPGAAGRLLARLGDGAVATAGGAVAVLGGALAVAAMASASAMSFRRGGEPVGDEPNFLVSLERELDRSRRHGRPFVLIRVPLRSAPVAERRRRRRRDLPAVAGGPSTLEPVLRSTDDAWTTGTDLYLLLPESDRRHGRICLERLRRRAPELLDDEAARIVAFPDDGVTSGALLNLLQGERAEIAAELPLFVPAGALLESHRASGATA